MTQISTVGVVGLTIVLALVGCSGADTTDESTAEESTMTAHKAATDHEPGTIDHTVVSIEGDTVDLSGYRGRPMLIVNTASRCGFTKQYETLQELYERFGDRGFVIIGFPSNDFGNQEPGTNGEIADFCRLNYGVTFPMMAKVHTKGAEQAAIYRTLTGEGPEATRGEIRWNFTKFLVDTDGLIVARFESAVDPMSDEIAGAVEAMLRSRD